MRPIHRTDLRQDDSPPFWGEEWFIRGCNEAAALRMVAVAAGGNFQMGFPCGDTLAIFKLPAAATRRGIEKRRLHPKRSAMKGRMDSILRELDKNCGAPKVRIVRALSLPRAERILISDPIDQVEIPDAQNTTALYAGAVVDELQDHALQGRWLAQVIRCQDGEQRSEQIDSLRWPPRPVIRTSESLPS